MNRSIEDRLTAALEARAELVTHDDLAPLDATTPAPRRPRRGAVLLLAAAATAAAVAVPFALDGGEGSPEPGPAGPPSAGVPEPTPSAPPSTAPSASPTPPRDAVVTGRQRADVDGDGRPDAVRVLLYTTDPDGVADGAVEVTLATGRTGTATMPEGYAPDLLPAFAVDGDGREQVLLSHTAGGDEAALLVYAWQDGGLVQAEPSGDAPLALGLDGQGTAYHYYTDDRGLVSWLRLDRTQQGDGRTYRVREWVWSLQDARLVPTRAGDRCLDVTTQRRPRPCA